MDTHDRRYNQRTSRPIGHRLTSGEQAVRVMALCQLIGITPAEWIAIHDYADGHTDTLPELTPCYPWAVA